MNVYVVLRKEWYESFTKVLGVYSSIDKAEAAVRADAEASEYKVTHGFEDEELRAYNVGADGKAEYYHFIDYTLSQNVVD